MTWIILAFVLVVLSAFSARFLISAVRVAPVRTPEYNVLAQKVSRWYKVISWAAVTFFLLSTLTQLFLNAVYQTNILIF